MAGAVSGGAFLHAWQPSSAQREVRNAVARAFGIEPHGLVSQARRRPVARARQAAAWVLKQRWPKLSYPQIGKMLGGRDHSTIIHGYRLIETLREWDPDLRALTDALVAGDPRTAEVSEAFRSAAAKVPNRPSARTLERRFMAEVLAEPEPTPSKLRLGLRGEPGCPGLTVEEIERRRAANAAARRAHELGQLAAERHRYRLPKRGLALSEMAL